MCTYNEFGTFLVLAFVAFYSAKQVRLGIHLEGLISTICMTLF